MEYIRHDGPLRCSNPQCNRVEENRNVYYCFHEGRRISWVVCGKCGAWTRVSYGVEEIGRFPEHFRRDIRKIKDFDLAQYGTNW